MRRSLGQWWRSVWNVLRELTTDDAYERYRQHHEQQHAHALLLNRRDFYILQQAEKWNGIKRCC